jgi:hypothetical protein
MTKTTDARVPDAVWLSFAAPDWFRVEVPRKKSKLA